MARREASVQLVKFNSGALQARYKIEQKGRMFNLVEVSLKRTAKYAANREELERYCERMGLRLEKE